MTPRFFAPAPDGGKAVITGDDDAHITKSLRMRRGDRVTLCDGAGSDYDCVIESTGDAVLLRVDGKRPSEGEPDIGVTLYQALPKGDKLELIIQKAVELGVKKIVPVLTARCVPQTKERSAAKKLERLNRIALEAAKQCGRGVIPEVSDIVTIKDAAGSALQPLKIAFYEGGGVPLSSILPAGLAGCSEIAVFIGPEGGFEESEISLLRSAGIVTATLGPRILRTETAAIAALSAVMLLTGNLG